MCRARARERESKSERKIENEKTLTPKRPIMRYFMIAFHIGTHKIFSFGWNIWEFVCALNLVSRCAAISSVYLPACLSSATHTHIHSEQHSGLAVLYPHLMLIWTVAFGHFAKISSIWHANEDDMIIKENWLRFVHTYYYLLLFIHHHHQLHRNYESSTRAHNSPRSESRPLYQERKKNHSVFVSPFGTNQNNGNYFDLHYVVSLRNPLLDAFLCALRRIGCSARATNP